MTDLDPAADALDAALEADVPGGGDELTGLLEVAAALRQALQTWRLRPSEREALYAAVLRRRRRLRWRRPLRGRGPGPALIGGGLVTVAAGTAIAVALLRGRRQLQPPAPA